MIWAMKEVIFSPGSDTTGNNRRNYNKKALLIYQFNMTSQNFTIDCFSKPTLPSIVYEI
ncbi:unnamed protein product [Penicillium nalgiovense]|uniref:Uncharacterized protein n=1 Tax=Penicillium nalgiovense TaxID=60175 RepID=A0A9W4MZ99_PENNA|nr:unnamed protein product [Penicillium nalgiovense]CAG7980226.1 unnamed protein product [Penicillium nalgiovense]CAG8001169.1 unnamed protein product [Penicillium nalgiovense]CAG8091807.1 unnamed protein product [Penicillium nalgiovense]CAG8107142.1 unnamed protein product [Penicillium nalgiovense]